MSTGGGGYFIGMRSCCVEHVSFWVSFSSAKLANALCTAIRLHEVADLYGGSTAISESKCVAAIIRIPRC